MAQNLENPDQKIQEEMLQEMLTCQLYKIGQGYGCDVENSWQEKVENIDSSATLDKASTWAPTDLK